MSWWWCLEHNRAESEPDVKAERRVGPYQTAEEARHWREQFAERNERLDREDAEWEGEEP